jgi:hypothetical protein
MECYVWDFTLKSEDIEDEEILKDSLQKYCKKWTFQLELSDSGYEHYQGRISLIKKKSLSALIKFFKQDSFWNPVHFSPTSNNAKGEIFYVIKEDTRIKGPWCEKDEIIYIPRQIREMEGLRPFQEKIIALSNIWDKRTINLVYCESGNLGKSLLVGYCRAHKIGRALPPINDTKDLLRMVCDLPTSKMYLFDMPRAMNKERLFQFYSAVETIKDGYAYDDRYNFREKIFDCPNIWIFSNNLPDHTMLSKDRWKIWTINSVFELVDLEF